MSYTISTSSLSECVASGNSVKTLLRLPDTILGTSASPVYPVSYSTKVNAGESETFDLAAKGYTKVRLLVVRSTRPIRLTLDIPEGGYTLPQATFAQLVLDTKEQGAGDPLISIVFDVPAAPGTPPSPRPEAYPAALIDVFLACEEG